MHERPTLPDERFCLLPTIRFCLFPPPLTEQQAPRPAAQTAATCRARLRPTFVPRLAAAALGGSRPPVESFLVRRIRPRNTIPNGRGWPRGRQLPRPAGVAFQGLLPGVERPLACRLDPRVRRPSPDHRSRTVPSDQPRPRLGANGRNPSFKPTDTQRPRATSAHAIVDRENESTRRVGSGTACAAPLGLEPLQAPYWPPALDRGTANGRTPAGARADLPSPLEPSRGNDQSAAPREAAPQASRVPAPSARRDPQCGSPAIAE